MEVAPVNDRGRIEVKALLVGGGGRIAKVAQETMLPAHRLETPLVTSRRFVTELVRTMPSRDPLLESLRLLLQLPRFSRNELSRSEVVLAELEKVKARIARDQFQHQSWLESGPWHYPLSSAWQVRRVQPQLADLVHSKFHYIGSKREGISFGLFWPTSASGAPPACLLTFSKYDLSPRFLGSLDAKEPSVVVLSRAYSFRWAPPNAFSFTLRRALEQLAELIPPLSWVLTYLNPNLGFDATSLQATNWSLVAKEPARYAYLDGNYITDRELHSMAAKADLSVQVLVDSGRLRFSQALLQPLELYALKVRG